MAINALFHRWVIVYSAVVDGLMSLGWSVLCCVSENGQFWADIEFRAVVLGLLVLNVLLLLKPLAWLNRRCF